MDNYICKILIHEGHNSLSSLQLAPHKNRPIVYGAKQQSAAPNDSIPTLNGAGILRIQRIMGALLYYARTVNNKLLIVLSTIGSQ